MGKNNTKAEKAKRNQAYAAVHKKKAAPVRRFGRPTPPTGASSSAGSAVGPATGAPGAFAPRTMYPAVCSSCGIETTVPFEPIAGKPVQCRGCFQPKARA